MDAHRAKSSSRADSGFCRESIMAWCKAHDEIYYVLASESRGRRGEWDELRATRLTRPYEFVKKSISVKFAP